MTRFTFKKFSSTIVLLVVFNIFLPINTFAQDIVWKKTLGSFANEYTSAIAVSDAIIAVGASYGFGLGDWIGVEGNGGSNAIIVKYNNLGDVIWKKRFGGIEQDWYSSITAVPNGLVAVGSSVKKSFNTGDWEGITAKGIIDAIMVKYDNNGNIVWKKNFGGEYRNYFTGITKVSDGIIAVGNSYFEGLGTGDWEGIKGKGDYDAIIVKYDHDGNVVWKKNFGGNDDDFFSSVTTVSDGVIAVGTSYSGSFGNGDWKNIESKGNKGYGDAIIVKYDFEGNVVWKKNFGGKGGDDFYFVITISDGIVVVGTSSSTSFGTGDWEGFTGKGNFDAIIVKYDYAGNIVWKKNFGGSGMEVFKSVTAVSDGFVAVGYSLFNSFDTGDWEGILGKGDVDAIIVKYDHDGNVVWKKNFGGNANDAFESVIATSNSVIAVGASYCGSFDSGDWEDIACKGFIEDAIIVKYSGAGIGIDEPKQGLSEIRVFPNPTSGQLRITNYELRITSIEVFDVYGRKIEGMKERRSEGVKEVVLDISGFSAGIYFVKIITEKGVAVKKVVKQ